jgi:FkbM family methyltransferase
MPPKGHRVLLPDGTDFACLQPWEAYYLYEEMPGYFRHGIVVKEGDIIFDVGANIGMFGLHVHRLTQGNMLIFSFEPIPDIFNTLRSNAERVAPEQWKVFPFGLASCEQTVTFAYHPNATVWSSAFPDDSSAAKRAVKQSILGNPQPPRSMPWLRWLPGFARSLVVDLVVRRSFQKQSVNCQVRTLSQVVGEYSVPRIDLLKIDVERGEMDVLRGIDNADWPKIRQIVIEVHGTERLQAITDLLQDKGFASIEVDHEEALAGVDVLNVYATRA